MKPCSSASLETFLAENGTLEAARSGALTRVLARQPAQDMQRQGITKAALAERMHTSRARVDRILNARGNVTLASLQRAASVLGRQLRVEWV